MDSVHANSSTYGDSALISPIQDEFIFNYELHRDFTVYHFHKDPTLGERISVFLLLENRYLPSIFSSIDDDGKHVIHNGDDVDVEIMDFCSEIWRYDSDNVVGGTSRFIRGN